MTALLLTALLTIAEPKTAFDELKSLVGAWEAKTEKGSKVKVSYKLVSNDTVLVQTYVASSGKETMTVFHQDGARLIATHYCAQGNQPRLVLAPAATNKEKGSFVFTFLDVTNLAKPEASHLVRFELRLARGEAHQQIDTYASNGKAEASTLDFKRVASGPAPM